MYLKQISVFVENRPGAVRAPCAVLASAGVNMTTLTLADTNDFGILRIITKDWEKACEALRAAKFAVKVSDVMAIRVDDVPGGLVKVLDTLEKHGLNVEYMYAAVSACSGTPVMIFRFEDTEGAAEKLRAAPDCRAVGPDQFFSLK